MFGFTLKKKVDVCLVIGHRRGAKGTSNVPLKIREFDLNEKEAQKVKILLDHYNISNTIIYRDDTYYGYSKLPSKINQYKPKMIVSFHHNAFDGIVGGTETLCYENSSKGISLASIMQKNVSSVLGFNDRGVKERSVEHDGGYLLKYTSAPCVILEPCFMDNTEELKAFIPKIDAYCEAVANGIIEYHSKI